MEENYDVIICGTGLKECILSGLLSTKGKKVLHIDRNNYYGEDSATLDLAQIFEKYGKENKKYDEKIYLNKKEWNIDLTPKFTLSDGELIELLVKTKVIDYLEFKVVEGNYILKNQKIYKVPSTEMEIIKTNLMSFMEKRKFKNFIKWCIEYESGNKKATNKFDLSKISSGQLFKSYGFNKNTVDFIECTIALYSDKKYIDNPALELVKKVNLYLTSFAKFGNSPFIYPTYGIGDIPQAFSRLSAVWGGTYMLNQNSDGFLYDENKKIKGIYCGSQKAYAPLVISSPNYAKEYIQKKHSIIRITCLLNHPVPDTKKTESAQIILPSDEFHKKSNIYINILTHNHFVCPKDYWLVFISTQIETDDSLSEVEPAMKIIEPILEKFIRIDDCYFPDAEKKVEGLVITESLDPCSHFENEVEDVKRCYKEIMKEELNIKGL